MGAFQGPVVLTWELPLTSTSSAKWTFTGWDRRAALFSGVMKEDLGPWGEGETLGETLGETPGETPGETQGQVEGDGENTAGKSWKT